MTLKSFCFYLQSAEITGYRCKLVEPVYWLNTYLNLQGKAWKKNWQDGSSREGTGRQAWWSEFYSWTQMMEGENWYPQELFWPPHIHQHTHTYTQINVKIKKSFAETSLSVGMFQSCKVTTLVTEARQNRSSRLCWIYNLDTPTLFHVGLRPSYIFYFHCLFCLVT